MASLIGPLESFARGSETTYSLSVSDPLFNRCSFALYPAWSGRVQWPVPCSVSHGVSRRCRIGAAQPPTAVQ
eukprot:10992279-Heterocapsa_arctica.AAC.1